MKTFPSPSRLFVCFLSLLAVPGGLFYSPAFAQQEGLCEITVREIVAENTGRGLASGLKDLEKELGKLSYSTFRIEQTFRCSGRKGESNSFDLLGKNRLVLTAESFEEGKIRLKVVLSPESSSGKKLEMPLRIPDGGTFIIAGPQIGESVLFLAITAKM